jgi:hypothetical protein
MRKSELKKLIKQIVTEAIGLGVAEGNLQESAPPDFPPALEKKLLSQYKDNPPIAYATMWKMHNAKKKGHAKVNEMWAAWEAKGMNEAVSGMNVAYIAHVDNTVYPMTGDEIANIIKKHGVKMEWLGNAKYGKVWDDERTKYYEFKISGTTGEVDSLVDELSQENGIDFQNAKLKESHDGTDMSNSEEKKEVGIAKQIKKHVDAFLKMHGQLDEVGGEMDMNNSAEKKEVDHATEIKKLAAQLLKMHGK